MKESTVSHVVSIFTIICTEKFLRDFALRIVTRTNSNLLLEIFCTANSNENLQYIYETCGQ
jgi:transcriptional regulator of met regulon